MTDRTTTSAGLLDRLRLLRSHTDWRRDSPYSSWEDFAIELAQEEKAGTLNQREQLEATAYIHRLALDPFATLISLVELYDSDPSQTRALSLLRELTGSWDQAVAVHRSTADLSSRSQENRMVAHFRLFAEKHQTTTSVQLSFVNLLRHVSGASAALNYVEMMSLPPQELVDIYFNLALDTLVQHPNERNLQRVFVEPLPFAFKSSFDASRYRFHRGILTEILRWNCTFNSAFSDSKTRKALLRQPLPSNSSVEFGHIIGMTSSAIPEQHARWLMATSSFSPLWRSIVPDHESLRMKVAMGLMAIIPKIKSASVLNASISRLIVCLPQTIAYWNDSELRKLLLKLVLEQSKRLPYKIRHHHIGLAAFGVPDLDVVSREYLTIKRHSPEMGYSTYLDFRHIAPSAKPDVLNSDSFQFDFQENSPDDGSSVIITSSNKNYFQRYSLQFAKSLAATQSTGPIHFHIIGNTDGLEENIEAIRKVLSFKRITFSTEAVIETRPFYYASARFLRTAEWLRRFNRTIIVTDIDIGWRVAPELVNKTLLGADVGLRVLDCVRHYVMYRTHEAFLRFPRLKPWECTSANIYLVRSTPGGQRFADLLADITTQHLKRFLGKMGTHWYIDQNILTSLYAYVLRMEPSVEVVSLDSVTIPFAPHTPLHDDRLEANDGRHWIANSSLNFSKSRPLPWRKVISLSLPS